MTIKIYTKNEDSQRNIDDLLDTYIKYLDFPAQIDDRDEIDDWEAVHHRTGNRVPLGADSWYQSAPSSASIVSSGDYAGIKINIWSQFWTRAKVRRFIAHSLAGGRNLGHHALRWRMILYGNTGEMVKYSVLSVLLDTITRFLYEYNDT